MCEDSISQSQRPKAEMISGHERAVDSGFASIASRAYLIKRREVLLIELGWIEDALQMERTKDPNR